MSVNLYKRRMDEIKLSEDAKKRVLDLYEASGMSGSMPGMQEASGMSGSVPGMQEASGRSGSMPGMQEASGMSGSMPGMQEASGMSGSMPEMQEASGRKERMDMKLRSLVKPAAAVAACAVLLCGFVVSGNIAVKRARSAPDYGGAGKNAVVDTDAGTVAAADHTFTILANAAELTADTSVPAVILDAGKTVDVGTQLANGWSLYRGEDEKLVSYTLGLDLLCQGEGIKSVTYRVNRGCFSIVGTEGSRDDILLDETLYEGVFDAPSQEVEAKEGSDSKLWNEYVTGFTVAYDNQQSKDVFISLCGEKSSERFWELFGMEEAEKEKEAFEELLGDVVITCTAAFEDGTTVSREIEVACEMVGGQTDMTALGLDGAVELHEAEDEASTCLVYRLKK